jgi:hypothetical protein
MTAAEATHVASAHVAATHMTATATAVTMRGPNGLRCYACD